MNVRIYDNKGKDIAFKDVNKVDNKGVISILFAHLLMKYVIAICGFNHLDCDGCAGKEGGGQGGVCRDLPLIHKMSC